MLQPLKKALERSEMYSQLGPSAIIIHKLAIYGQLYSATLVYIMVCMNARAYLLHYHK
jgi:hypothetical protein